MTGNAALNEVVRVLSTELGKGNNRVIIGSTEPEKQVLKKHALIGKQRAVLGFATGAAVSGGVWKALGGGQRRWIGGVTMAGGAMFGVMYGLLSIRQGLFHEILSLPDDQSPFAVQARRILDEQLPKNEFYLEVKEKLKNLEVSTGSWDSTPSFPVPKSPSDDADVGFRGFNTQPKSPAPRLPPLPPRAAKQDEDFALNNDSDDTAAAESSASPFFFGRPPSTVTVTSHPGNPADQKKEAKDDDFFNYGGWGDDNTEQDATKPKPTSWEEIRRRAASGRN